MKPEVSVSDQLALATFPVSLSLLHYISMNASGDVEGALAWLQLQTQSTPRFPVGQIGLIYHKLIVKWSPPICYLVLNRK